MGILDFFKKKKDSNLTNDVRNNIPLELEYRSGVKATINFDENLMQVPQADGSIKYLQRANIIYERPNGEFITKPFLMEPMVMQSEDGVKYYDTKGYYNELAKNNMSLVKGFFEEQSLNSLDTNYIGYIGQNEDGKYNRSFDNVFLKQYKVMYELQKNQNDKNSINRENDFRQELMQKINNTPVNYKTSHAEDLSKYKYQDFQR